MDVSDAMLRSVIDGVVVGSEWPFSTGKANTVEAHMRQAVQQLELVLGISLKADWDHYGSGFASYVDIFCPLVQEIKDSNRYDYGLRIYLCRLAPVAVMAPASTVTSLDNCSFSSGFIRNDGKWEAIPESMHDVALQCRRMIEEYGWTWPEPSRLGEPLGFDANIPTILADPPYHIFDALFYWED